MPKNTLKNSNVFNAEALSFITNDELQCFDLNLKIHVENNSDIIYKESFSSILEVFDYIKFFNLRSITYLDDIPSGYTINDYYLYEDEELLFIGLDDKVNILNYDFNNLSINNTENIDNDYIKRKIYSGYINLSCRLFAKSSKDYNDIKDNPDIVFENIASLKFTKVGAPKFFKGSGSISNSYKKKLRDIDSKSGTIPATKNITGHKIQDYNDKFNEYNVFDFNESLKSNVNNRTGLNLIEETTVFHVTVKNKQYYFNDRKIKNLNLAVGKKYIFDQSHHSNNGYPISFFTNSDLATNIYETINFASDPSFSNTGIFNPGQKAPDISYYPDPRFLKTIGSSDINIFNRANNFNSSHYTSNNDNENVNRLNKRYTTFYAPPGTGFPIGTDVDTRPRVFYISDASRQFNIIKIKIDSRYSELKGILNIDSTKNYIINDDLNYEISLIDNIYQDQFSLKEEKSEIKFNPDFTDSLTAFTKENITSNKKINSKILDNNIVQNRFEEDYYPFDESKYCFSDNQSNPIEISNSEFQNSTISTSKSYNLSEQKQIKITLDFSESIDLNLLNTKFAFNYPDPSNDKADFKLYPDTKDKLVNTNYFNFLEDTAFSISSHHMPTAYFDFENKEWNYLEGGKNFDIENITNQELIKTNFWLGHKNNYQNKNNAIVEGPYFIRGKKKGVGLDKYYYPVYTIEGDTSLNRTEETNFLHGGNFVYNEITENFEIDPNNTGSTFSFWYDASIDTAASGTTTAPNSEAYSLYGSLFQWGNDLQVSTRILYNENIIDNKHDQMLFPEDHTNIEVNKEYTDILNTFCFDNNNQIDDNFSFISYYENQLNRNLLHFTKPILTTPSMRVTNKNSDQRNDSPICQISSSYGFPWKATWQPHKNHTLDMSNYITKDFLLEKVIIKGKYTSKGEMPVKKGNFCSGYKKLNSLNDTYSLIQDANDFNSQYDMKDDEQNVISNNLTFFILNEKKFENYFQTKLKINPIQSYNNYFIDASQKLINENKQLQNLEEYSTFGFELYNFDGNFYRDLTVNNNNYKSNILSNDSLFTINSYNDVSLESKHQFAAFRIIDASSQITKEEYNICSFNYSNFYKLSNDLTEEADEAIYFNYLDEWNNNNINTDVINITNKKYNIKEAYSEYINESRSRDLVTYSNLLLLDKTDIIDIDDHFLFDSQTYSNIDKMIVTDKPQGQKLNLNRNNPEEFVLTSFCKNQKLTNYSDESIYRIKSNYYENDEFELYNESYNLEGQFLGEPNGLGIKSDRIIHTKSTFDSSKGSYSKDLNSNKYSSHSGKIFQTNSNDSIINHTYLLKPEDSLVFGVTSNCNGQVMPTVVSLHDKLEIILIGRDYTESKDTKSNTSKSIRKTIIGNNREYNIGSNLYQTKGSYFDNIWEKTLNSEEQGIKIGENSSGKFGSYSGIISLENESIVTINEAEGLKRYSIKYLEDTVMPSLGFIYTQCMNKTPLFSKDFNDIYSYLNHYSNFTDLNHDTSFSSYTATQSKDFNVTVLKSFASKPSNKIIFTENFLKSDLDEDTGNNASTFTNSIITNWSSTFHLEEFKQKLQYDADVQPEFDVNDYTYSYFNSDFYDRYESYLYYDTNSYKVNTHPYINMLYGLHNNDNKLNSYILSDENIDISNRYLSLKRYTAPMSSLYKYQSGVEIKNYDINIKYKSYNPNSSISSLENKTFIESNKINNILRSTTLGGETFPFIKINNIDSNDSTLYLNKVTLQYFNSNFNLKEYYNDMYSSKWSNDFSPQWHIVFEINQNQLETFLQNTDYDTNSLRIGDYFDIQIWDDTSSQINRIYDKTCIFIYKHNTNNLYQFAVPLYYWETNELVDNENFIESHSTGKLYSKDNYTTNLSISLKDDYNSSLWYSKLSNDKLIASNKHVYDLFIKDTQLSSFNFDPGVDNGGSLETIVSREFVLPYTSLQRNDSRFYNSATKQFNSPYNSVTFDGLLSNITGRQAEDSVDYNDTFQLLNIPNFSFRLNKHLIDSNSISNLNNDFRLRKNSDIFKHRKYFNNNKSDIRDRINLYEYADRRIDKNKINIEKIYRSPIYKKDKNSKNFIKTNSLLVYKVHKIIKELNSQIQDLSIEVICFDTDTGVLKSDILDLKGSLLDFNNNDILRVYEERLLENKDISSLKILKDDVPYFEIDLSSTKTIDTDNVTLTLKQIPYSFNKISKELYFNDSVTDDSNVNPIENTTSWLELYSNSLYTNIKNKNDVSNSSSDINHRIDDIRNYGTPIFKITDNENEIMNDNLESQENKIKNFLYGFSTHNKNKNRMPTTNISGFKYGVLNSIKKTNLIYFNNRKYGQFADKVIGSRNNAEMRKLDSGNVVTSRPVEKRFIDNDLNFINFASNEINITSSYNKDRYARSTYPYIENKENELSQLNPNNNFYDVDVASRF